MYCWTMGRKMLNSSLGRWRRCVNRAHAEPVLAPATASLMSASSAPTSLVPRSRSSTWELPGHQQGSPAPSCICMLGCLIMEAQDQLGCCQAINTSSLPSSICILACLIMKVQDS